jgi:inosose dehydratase
MSYAITCFPNSYGRFGTEAAIEHLPTVGVSWIEFPIRTAGRPTFFGDEPLLTDASTPAEADAMRQRLEAAGLVAISANVTAGNPLEADVVDVTRRKIAVASRLGAKYVVGGAGAATTADEQVILFDHLRKLGDCAAEHGIVYCFETHPGLCVDADGMLETMRRLDHEHLKLNFDTGNVTYYNADADVLESLRKVREHVRHVHLKDHNGQPGEWHFPALGAAGGVNFRVVRELLDEVGFTGPYSLEIEGIDGEEKSLALHRRRIAESVAELRRCGYFD